MAVALEFIDFIVPISLIQKKYPGGWAQCQKDHASFIGKRVWFDQYLFRDGAMNPCDMEDIIQKWQAYGFRPLKDQHGQLVWNECCIVESLLGGPTLPCAWLALTEDGKSAYLQGTRPGVLVGPDDILSTEELDSFCIIPM